VEVWHAVLKNVASLLFLCPMAATPRRGAKWR